MDFLNASKPVEQPARDHRDAQAEKLEKIVTAVEQEAARLLTTAERVDRLGNKEGAIQGYDLVIQLLDTTATRLKDYPVPDWSYMVARALCAKGDAFATQGDKRRAAKVYEQVVLRFGSSENDWVRRVVTDAWQGVMMTKDGEENLD